MRLPDPLATLLFPGRIPFPLTGRASATSVMVCVGRSALAPLSGFDTHAVESRKGVSSLLVYRRGSCCAPAAGPAYANRLSSASYNCLTAADPDPRGPP